MNLVYPVQTPLFLSKPQICIIIMNIQGFIPSRKLVLKQKSL